jgi:toxin CcdB
VARFDVHALLDGSGYVIDCQADLLSHYQTRLVVPVIALDQGPEIATRLNPVFEIDGQKMGMYTQFMASIPKAALGPVILSLAEHGVEIGPAIDWLLAGT